MLVCYKCQRIMTVKRNGINVPFTDTHVYMADLWECPGCGARIANCNNGPTHIPKGEMTSTGMDIDMRGAKGVRS